MRTVIGIENIDPRDLPLSVFKFRSWNDGDNQEVNRIITHQEVRLSSPRQLLADYPECILPHDFEVVTEEDLMQAAMIHAKREFPHAPESELLRIAHSNRKKMIFHHEKNRKETVEYFNKVLYDCVGIFCTTLNCSEVNIWERLGNLAKDYCVEFDTWELFNVEGFGAAMGYVEYYDEANPPRIFPISSPKLQLGEEIRRQIISVPKRYSYENEFRFWRTNYHPITMDYCEYTSEERLKILPKHVYKSVIIGEDMSKNDREELMAALSSNFPELSVFIAGYDSASKTYKKIKIR